MAGLVPAMAVFNLAAARDGRRPGRAGRCRRVLSRTLCVLSGVDGNAAIHTAQWGISPLCLKTQHTPMCAALQGQPVPFPPHMAHSPATTRLAATVPAHSLAIQPRADTWEAQHGAGTLHTVENMASTFLSRTRCGKGASQNQWVGTGQELVLTAGNMRGR